MGDGRVEDWPPQEKTEQVDILEFGFLRTKGLEKIVGRENIALLWKST